MDKHDTSQPMVVFFLFPFKSFQEGRKGLQRKGQRGHKQRNKNVTIKIKIPTTINKQLNSHIDK